MPSKCLAAALLALIRHRATGPAVNRLAGRWREGARLTLASRTLRTLLVFTLITGVGEAIMMAITALRAAAMLVGIGLAGVLPAHVGIVPVIAVQGFGYFAGGLLVLAFLKPSVSLNPSLDSFAESGVVIGPGDHPVRAEQDGGQALVA